MSGVAKTKKRRAIGDSQSSSKRRRPVRDDESLLDIEAGLNKAFQHMDSQLLADHIAQRTTRFGTELSPVELSDLHISANAIRDTTTWQKSRTLENLPEFLESVAEAKQLVATPGQNGSPHTIIVAGAGMRAADLVRLVRKYQTKGNTVAKLFAKHIKLEEAIKFMQNNRSGVAVGTPKRLMDLLDNEALSVDHLDRMVVDVSYIDQKKRGIMDMKETLLPLVRWLTRAEFMTRYTDDDRHLDLIFY